MFKAQSFLRSKKEAIAPVCVFVEGGKLQKTSPTNWYWVGSPWRIKEVWTNITIYLSSGASGKDPACQCRREKRQGFYPWVGKIPWSRKWQPTPVFLAGKFHGQRSMLGYHTWGCKESDITKQLSTHTHTFIKGQHRKVRGIQTASLFPPGQNQRRY